MRPVLIGLPDLLLHDLCKEGEPLFFLPVVPLELCTGSFFVRARISYTVQVPERFDGFFV